MAGNDANTKLLIHGNHGGGVKSAFCHMAMEDNSDDGSGANAVTNIGTPTYTAGKLNNALTLDGSTDALNLDALAADVASDTTGTISAWINLGAVDDWIFAFGDTNAQSFVGFSTNSSAYLLVAVYVAGTYQWIHTSTAAFSTSTWYHVVVVQNGVSPVIYVDGSNVTNLTTTTDTTAWNGDITTLDNGRIGCLNYNSGGNVSFANGQIDDFRYYRCALSQTEIDALYNSGSGTEDSIITDASAGGHTAIQTFNDAQIDESAGGVQTVPDGESFGGYAVYNGSTAYQTVPDHSDFEVGTNFTVEAYVYINNFSNVSTICYHGNTGPNLNDGWVFDVNTSAQLRFSARSSSTVIGAMNSAVDSVPANKWTHVAASKSGSSYYLFIDGVQVDTDTDATAVGDASSSLFIGRNEVLGRYFNGHIDDLRISSSARYVTGFTPPSEPFTSDASTRLLLSNDSDVTTADGVNSHTVTNNNVTWSPGGKWNSGALTFDGVGDYVSIPDSADWDIFTSNTTDQTFDFQMNAPYSSATNNTIIGQWDASPLSYWILQTDDTGNGYLQATFYQNGAVKRWFQNTKQAFTIPAASTWQHVAFVKTGAYMGVYLAGNQVLYGFMDSVMTSIAEPLIIGDRSTGAAPYAGNLDEVRVQADNYFSAAPNSFPAAPLLIYGDSLKKSYGVFNGTSAYMSAPDHADWNWGTGDVTVEAWIKPSSIAAWFSIYNQKVDANNHTELWWDTTGGGRFYFDNQVSGSYGGATGIRWYASASPVVDEWNHIMYVRSGANWYFFLNGVEQAKTLVSGSYTTASIPDRAAIAEFMGRSGFGFFPGDVDEYRISKGSARQTSGFTPPTTRYTSDANTSLLLQFDTSLTTDSGNTGHTVTNNNVTHEIKNEGYGDQAVPSGTAGVQDPGTTKFNDDTSIYFDGNSDYLTVTDTSGTDYDIIGSLTDSWTVDLWVYNSDTVVSEYLITQYEDVSNRWHLYSHTAGVLWAVVSSSITNFAISSGTAMSTNTWQHVALVKSGSHWGIYLDGVQTGYVTQTQVDTFTGPLYVGQYGGGGNFFDGYMEQVQITKGNKFGVVPNVGLTSTITVPTAVLTQDTITVPTEEYSPPDVDYTVPSALSLTLTDQVPVHAVQHSQPGQFPLSLVLETPTIVTVTPHTPAAPEAASLTLFAPTIMISSNEDAGTTSLTLTLEDPTITAECNVIMDNIELPLGLTVSAGFAPTLGSLAPTIARYIKDPIVTGGCPQCGTFMYKNKSREVKGEVVKRGRNYDIDKGRREDRYVRCGRCGFVLHRDRHSSLNDGSRAGWGMKYTEIEAGE